jgi:hypothetical protein
MSTMKKNKDEQIYSVRWLNTPKSQRLCINGNLDLYLAEVEDGYVYCYPDPWGDVQWVEQCGKNKRKGRDMALCYLMKHKILSRNNLFKWSKV